MASHPHFVGRLTPMPFSSLNPMWPFPQHPALNTPFNLQFPIFQNQPSFSYMLGQQSIYNTANQGYYKPAVQQIQSKPSQAALNLPTGNANVSSHNKIQKSKKTIVPATINLISDDQEPIQVDKASEEKITNRSSKSNQYNALDNLIQGDGQKQKLKNEINIDLKEKNQTKLKNQAKNHKTKQIIKKSVDLKKDKIKIETAPEVPAKRPTFSQRIVQKQETVKEPFRLSKRQRQLLQVSFLRQSNSIILTGPQFQAKIPKFLTQTSKFSSWLVHKKERLLSRLYKEQEV